MICRRTKFYSCYRASSGYGNGLTPKTLDLLITEQLTTHDLPDEGLEVGDGGLRSDRLGRKSLFLLGNVQRGVHDQNSRLGYL